ncbi:221L [Invertebrate iridescent virus Kaz2018]|uniref:Uncharacterized protein 221L n=1 Tax=Invertebrate iridescent virus 6 TaxID=176652 RepID=221L_IIV6|nr:221L [Invertebrate iridescent virus 6]Q91FV0.1 RecName: Full=Uncharacterized protein 221L [Invertebrate iridescent virus 6]AAK82083.1 221L [Invertebrate iridescent virus 6]QMS79351.1 hypothetical protein IIV6-T1_220 [Invertebrate iridescent virus 6]QNH08631.1 221L [Invertebrate iridescent virus Kaz2018]
MLQTNSMLIFPAKRHLQDGHYLAGRLQFLYQLGQLLMRLQLQQHPLVIKYGQVQMV